MLRHQGVKVCDCVSSLLAEQPKCMCQQSVNVTARKVNETTSGSELKGTVRSSVRFAVMSVSKAKKINIPEAG